MEKLYLILLGLQLLLTLLYAPVLLRERKEQKQRQRRLKSIRQKREKEEKQAEKPSKTPSIVGKSHFELSQSKPEDANGSQAIAAVEKAHTFADRNPESLGIDTTPDAKNEASGAVPAHELDQLFADDNAPFFQLPIELEDDFLLEDEEEPVEGAAQQSLASGASFEDLKEAFQTAQAETMPSEAQRLSAGNTLLQLRQTDMFEQLIAQGEHVKQNISRLLDESLADFHARHQPAVPVAAANEPSNSDFDIRDFV